MPITNIYPDGNLWLCPECTHEWRPAARLAESEDTQDSVIKDAHGNVLNDGDQFKIRVC